VILGGDGQGHGARCGELWQIPEILAAAEQFDANVAAAFGIEARIDHARFHASAPIAAAHHNRAVDFNGVAANEAGAVQAHGGGSGFFFPGVARIFPAQAYRDAGANVI